MPWYIIRTKSRLEQKAEDAIKNNGYDVYCPRVKVTVLSGGGRKRIHRIRKKEQTDVQLRPLYSGYMFVRKDEALGALGMTFDEHGNRLNGVIGYIVCGDYIPVISDEAIEAMKDKVDSGTLDAYEGVTFRNVYKIGQRVKFKSGPLAGNQGVVKVLDKRNRIKVSTQALGSERLVEVTKLEELEALL